MSAVVPEPKPLTRAAAKRQKIFAWLHWKGREIMTDESLKQALEREVPYADNFNKKDAAGIAALFVDGGVHVNEAGPRKDIQQFYEAAFKSGSSVRMAITLDEVWSVGSDVATAVGEVC